MTAGGYALFTNMTATLDLDLSELLCRYVVDPATGALRVVDLTDVAAQACEAGAGSGGAAGSGTSPSVPADQVAQSLAPVLSDLTGTVPGLTQGTTGSSACPGS